MALNTDFTSGQILTAAQMNNFPRGLVSVTSATASSGTFTTIVTTITAPSFTAVANRLYRISYFEPVLQFTSGTVNTIAMTLKIGGVDILFNEVKISSATNNSGYLTTTRTLTAAPTWVWSSPLPPKAARRRQGWRANEGRGNKEGNYDGDEGGKQ
jgi:hypothetical protein